MFSSCRTCWRGTTGNLSLDSCRCRLDRFPTLPKFDLFNTTVTDVPTVAPSTIAGETKSVYSVLTTRGRTVEYEYPAETASPPVVPVDPETNNKTRAWIAERSATIRILVAASVSLVFAVLLICILVCLVRRKKKKATYSFPQRPETEGCETGEGPREVTTVAPQESSTSNFPLVPIDPIRQEAAVSQSPKTDATPDPEPPATRQRFPMLKKVTATVVNNGPPKRVARPVSRHDSTAPLVDHEAAALRDKWKDMSHASADHRNYHRASSLDDDERNFSNSTHNDKLSTLDEVGERTSKEPTQLEILPSRRFPAKSLVGTPSDRRAIKRPDSSTPLFHSDSVDSVEVGVA
ncbi:uncharacterized protein [Diadema antillarum]|uniref:uncharacterized protein n=1 Tax=Diadema antillarum TaxID=105358 RepID=UPI003A87B3E3